MAASPLITSPSEITDIILDYFPLAKIEGNPPKDTDPFLMQISFPPISVTMTLRSAVHREIFHQALKDWTKQIKKPDCPPLDPSQFSKLDTPLEEWQKFQRIYYETVSQQGKKCADIIVDYLCNPIEELHKTLFNLGFAPDQLKAPSKIDMKYFSEAYENVKQKSTTESKAFRMNLLKFYPHIAKIFIKNEVQEITAASSTDKRRAIKETLKQFVSGQEIAINEVTEILATQQQAVLINKVFLFVGPSGVGKTELAKAIAHVKRTQLLILNMEKYISEHSYTELFGAPSSYLGSDDLPTLAKKFNSLGATLIPSRNTALVKYKLSNVVILFDEFEKAHPKIRQSLLSLLDEGFIQFKYSETLSLGSSRNVEVEYRLDSSIIVCTSNLYKDELLAHFQIGRTGKEIAEWFIQKSQKDATNGFSAELLGRLVVIPFGPIPRGEAYQAAIQKFLKSSFTRLVADKRCKDIVVEKEKEVMAFIEDQLYGNGTGLREIKKAFERLESCIINNMSKWSPDPQNIKITVGYYSPSQCLIVKAEMFLSDWDCYESLKHQVEFYLKT